MGMITIEENIKFTPDLKETADEFYKNRLNNKMYDSKSVNLQTLSDGHGGVYYQLSSRVSYVFETNKMKEGDNNG